MGLFQESPLQEGVTTLQERVQAELTLLRQDYPDVEYHPEGHWVLVLSYPLPEGWNRTVTDVVFQIPEGYPGCTSLWFLRPLGLSISRQSALQLQRYSACTTSVGRTVGLLFLVSLERVGFPLPIYDEALIYCNG